MRAALVLILLACGSAVANAVGNAVVGTTCQGEKAEGEVAISNILDDELNQWTLLIDTMTPAGPQKPCGDFYSSGAAEAYADALVTLLLRDGESVVDSVVVNCTLPRRNSESRSRRIRATVTTTPLTSTQVNEVFTSFITETYRGGLYSRAVIDAGAPFPWAALEYQYLYWAKLDGRPYCTWWPLCISDYEEWACMPDLENPRLWNPDNAIPPSDW